MTGTFLFLFVTVVAIVYRTGVIGAGKERNETPWRCYAVVVCAALLRTRRLSACCSSIMHSCCADPCLRSSAACHNLLLLFVVNLSSSSSAVTPPSPPIAFVNASSISQVLLLPFSVPSPRVVACWRVASSHLLSSDVCTKKILPFASPPVFPSPSSFRSPSPSLQRPPLLRLPSSHRQQRRTSLRLCSPRQAALRRALRYLLIPSSLSPPPPFAFHVCL